MSTDPQTLRAEAFVEIGRAIESHTGLLLQRWGRRALEEQPGAKRVHHQVLLDDLGPLLQRLGRGLAEANPTDKCYHQLLAVEHGEQRWQAGWMLEEVVRDYQILRLVLSEFLEESLDRSLSCRESMAVGLALDEAIAASVQMYVQFRDEHAAQSAAEQARTAAASNRRKDEFLAVLAHELRNPLAPILNSLELMRQPTSDRTAVEAALDVAERQVHHIERLVDDLLDLTRIAHGKVELRKRTVELSQVVSEAVESVKTLVESRRHNLTLKWSAEPLELDADPARLRQVLANLLNNAAKYTEAGGQIWLSVDREGDEAVIRVRDDGVGIDADMLPRVFDLFAQSDGSSSRAPGGLGIGLSLVRGLVEMHGGSVSATSAGAHRGSEFIVRLPARPSVAANRDDAQVVVAPTTAAKPVKTAPDKSVRLLLVDDNKDAVTVLAILLRRLGHEVHLAHDGPTALETARACKPDVVLLDIGLPGMDGYRVAQELLRQPELSAIGLVAMTGYGQQEDIQRSQAAGFHHHLLKPVRLEHIRLVLDSLKR